ncbi:hypothetical protein NC652_001804 [Populus alba x Populus x berolinensis]|uniref:Uncharacterized protein n=1 Tax=Populus alba x Populus x berolinensis TaxID=444605 RepID=A0AAD6RM52_9ROSI|nr:hypothetical protein NC652_001804 [Populus alba x Populus x berolinensis]KAJ7011549.1 hypothetical protein NC653_001852 [Populus alba x Populus x berolinensis]
MEVLLLQIVFDIVSDDNTQVQHKTFAPFEHYVTYYLLLRQGSITMTNSLPISNFPIIDANEESVIDEKLRTEENSMRSQQLVNIRTQTTTNIATNKKNNPKERSIASRRTITKTNISWECN